MNGSNPFTVSSTRTIIFGLFGDGVECFIISIWIGILDGHIIFFWIFTFFLFIDDANIV